MEGLNYVVRSKRKLDGKVFFRTPIKLMTFDDAFEEAKRCARDLSKDYTYIITNVVDIAEVEIAEQPIKVTYLIKGD